MNELSNGQSGGGAHGSARILIVDDVRDEAELAQMLLQRQGLRVEAQTSARAALDLVAREDFDLVITDVNMDEMSGIELCERLLGTRPDVPVIVMTGQGSMEMAIAAMRAGAFDFLTKPVDPKLLGLSVARALKHRSLQQEVKRLRTEGAPRRGPLVGESAAMQRVYDLIQRVGPMDPSVLIAGESGTGKELVARAIHAVSPRKNGPFVAINCAAVPPTLLESELFGHARGAFTDAKTATRRALRAGHGRHALPRRDRRDAARDAGQAPARAAGAHRAPGRRQLGDPVRRAHRHRDQPRSRGRGLRPSASARTSSIASTSSRSTLPPLRERSSDVLLLAQHFLERFAEADAARQPCGISTAVAEKLLAYDWPGNVRELENCMERAVALWRASSERHRRGPAGEDPRLSVRSLRCSPPITRRRWSPSRSSSGATSCACSRWSDGNKSRAAQLLGLDRRTLYRKLDRWQEELAAGARPAA